MRTVKYCVLIIDGAADLPLPDHGNKTCLELARTPNLDAMAREGILGLARTIPAGMEPSSACGCISVLGYDPRVYYRGRAGIEASSMGIPVGKGDAVFRCNLVATRDGVMWDYSAGHISSEEARQLILALNRSLGDDTVHFYPGVGYRHILKLEGREETLGATCTAPHDIPHKPVADHMPLGPGSDLLRELMAKSEDVLREHPVNRARMSRGETPATMIWLFWGSGVAPSLPAFEKVYGVRAAMTSGVDLLRGLARITGMDVLNISGVTDGQDNDYAAQAVGALEALDKYDLVVIHIEAPDEAAHVGSVNDKVEAIQLIDREVVGRLRSWQPGGLRVLITPDHATPVLTRTHAGMPVPFMMWGEGFTGNGANRFTEAETENTGLFIDEGYKIMGRLVGRE